MKKILLFFLFSIIAKAQSLDTTFDSDGLINNPISNTPSIQNAYDGILQPDGKMIYVGRYFENGITYGLIVRYNSDGTKDTTFSNVGFSNLFGKIGQTVSLQNDGKIIVAGLNNVTRLTSEGALDTSFNTIGTKAISLSGQNMNIKCASVQSDNKIVVSGYISNGTNNDLAVARLNTDGTLDTTFDSDGIFTYNSTSIDQGFSHKIQTDGKIVVVGDTGATGAKKILLVRLEATGALDTAFGSNGVVINVWHNYGRDVQILSDGKIVVLGKSGSSIVLIKHTSSGAYDTSFNDTGDRMLGIAMSLETTGAATNLHHIPKLKVLATGGFLIACSSNLDYSVVKTDATGNLDTTFGTNGAFTSNFETDLPSVSQIKTNGNIIISGNSFTSGMNSDAKIKEIELSSNGTLIATNTKNVYLGVDKHILLRKNATGDFFVLVKTPISTLYKYDAFGQLDTSFGALGKVVLNDYYSDFIFDNSGKIILGGNSSIKLGLLNSAGTFDSGFNGGVAVDLTNFNFYHADALLYTPNNKILISCEELMPNGSHNLGFRQFNLDGTLDLSFGTNGIFNFRISPNLIYDYLEVPISINLQSDGKYLISGFSKESNVSGFSDMSYFVVRILPNGTVDTTYGNNGIVYFPSANNIKIVNSLILPDNKLLINFYSTSTPMNIYKTLKLSSDGSVDSTFGINGVSDDIVGTKNNNFCLQSDGKYLKAGSRNDHFSISRYNADGSVDTTFGTNGELTTVLGLSSAIDDILLQADGKIVVGGSEITSDYKLAVLARFTNTVLGTLEFSTSENVLSIYPNPIETNATFEFTLNNSETLTVEIYDVQGKLVQTIATNKTFLAGKHDLPIELQSNLNSGNYFLKLTTATGSQSIQIIKK
ncbi:T9SS type A sorting domain-containing protein [Flavobacterium terrigena]|uniref:Delta-60 repeat domain-containing protein/Por secretion system C-terminal sorting domain-containing protein n=1 Tax=Flavobacterium terrigena TaxID=402734 RepID=A0A1H6RJW7_9FLAO|nr:T9SS type A sorting domain-containing protein [Flavobacterium terrigena]SEI56079.1 delta-60 repeat domain-containing protein/Por secretion system C-terminal sorting domain-containing protein [Flavobacterium terrigena]